MGNFASLLSALASLELFGFGEQSHTPSSIIPARTSVSIRKASPSCVVLGFMCLALALMLLEEMASTPARERLKLGLRLPTTCSKLSLKMLSARSPGRRHSSSRAALAQEKCSPTGGLPLRAPTRYDAPPSASAAPPSAPAAQSGPAAARSLRADCDLSYLLTGVFSAPASGVFVRRPAASAGG